MKKNQKKEKEETRIVGRITDGEYGGDVMSRCRSWESDDIIERYMESDIYRDRYRMTQKIWWEGEWKGGSFFTFVI